MNEINRQTRLTSITVNQLLKPKTTTWNNKHQQWSWCNLLEESKSPKKLRGFTTRSLSENQRVDRYKQSLKLILVQVGRVDSFP